MIQKKKPPLKETTEQQRSLELLLQRKKYREEKKKTDFSVFHKTDISKLPALNEEDFVESDSETSKTVYIRDQENKYLGKEAKQVKAITSLGGFKASPNRKSSGKKPTPIFITEDRSIISPASSPQGKKKRKVDSAHSPLFINLADKPFHRSKFVGPREVFVPEGPEMFDRQGNLLPAYAGDDFFVAPDSEPVEQHDSSLDMLEQDAFSIQKGSNHPGLVKQQEEKESKKTEEQRKQERLLSKLSSFSLINNRYQKICSEINDYVAQKLRTTRFQPLFDSMSLVRRLDRKIPNLLAVSDFAKKLLNIFTEIDRNDTQNLSLASEMRNEIIVQLKQRFNKKQTVRPLNNSSKKEGRENNHHDPHSRNKKKSNTHPIPPFRVNVNICDVIFVIPIKNRAMTIFELISEAQDRFQQREGSFVSIKDLSMSNSGAILSKYDVVQDLLCHDDTVVALIEKNSSLNEPATNSGVSMLTITGVKGKEFAPYLQTDCSSLKSLNMSYNQVSAEETRWLFPQLKRFFSKLNLILIELDLSSIDLWKYDSWNQIFQLESPPIWPQLKSLSLSFNRLDDSIAMGIGNWLAQCPKIESINCSNCLLELSGAQAILDNLKFSRNSISVDLSDNKSLQGELNLFKINFFMLNLSNTLAIIPSHSLKQIEKFNCSHNVSITQSLEEVASAFSTIGLLNLTHLDLSYVDLLESTAVRLLSCFPGCSLQFLSIQGNQEIGQNPQHNVGGVLASFTRTQTSLRELDVSFCNLTLTHMSQIFQAVPSSSSIDKLYLSNNQGESIVLDLIISNFVEAEHSSLQEENLSLDFFVESLLTHCQGLSFLDISFNHIPGPEKDKLQKGMADSGCVFLI